MAEYPSGCVSGVGKTLPNLKPGTKITKLKQEFVPKIKLKAFRILGGGGYIILFQILLFVSTQYLMTKRI